MELQRLIGTVTLSNKVWIYTLQAPGNIIEVFALIIAELLGCPNDAPVSSAAEQPIIYTQHALLCFKLHQMYLSWPGLQSYVLPEPGLPAETAGVPKMRLYFTLKMFPHLAR